MNANLFVRPSLLPGPADIALIDVPDARQFPEQACDIVLMLGPDMLPDFAAALHEAQQQHGGRVLVLHTASQGRDGARTTFHASRKPGAGTKLFLAFHGNVVDGAHHVKVDDEEVRTLDFIDWLRTAPDGDAGKWTGRATLHTCSGLHVAREAEPGRPAWDDGECIVIGGRKSILQLDGVRVYRDMFVRILQERERDGAPDTTEMLARAASLSGAGVAVFGGARPQPLHISASASLDLMYQVCLCGEAKRQEALAAYERRSATSGAATRSEKTRSNEALQDIALADGKRMRDKLVARLMHLIFRKKFDEAVDMIFMRPELMFVRLDQGASNAVWLEKLGLSPDEIGELWQVANAQVHRAYSDAEIARQLASFGPEMNCDENLLKLVCRSQVCLDAFHSALRKDEFQDLIGKLLHVACAHGYSKEAGMLIRQGADVHALDGSGNSLWHQAIGNRQAAMFSLLEHAGAPMHIPNADKVLPLHVACLTGYLEGVRKLLDKGASLQAVEKHGWTALHFACMRGDKEIVSLLLEAGADPHAKDPFGNTLASWRL